jgi:acetyltransferase-like isoleucine patch superfamily enzyme
VVKDIRARILRRLYWDSLDIIAQIYSPYEYFKCWLWGINIDKNCKFVGDAQFYRAPGSEIKIGENCTFRSQPDSNLIGINHHCIISTHTENAVVVIGNNCGFSGVTIGSAEKIVIGNEVMCGANVIITDTDWHPIDPLKRHTSMGVLTAPTIIENNVWIGANSTVLKGVSIGENSVIGANSVVARSIPANVIAAGVPAKIIRSL